MGSPYSSLPSRNFWKTGVAEQHPLTISGLYKKKFPIGPETAIATAGSCFAQHIGGHLRKNGFHVLDAEPAPPGLDAETAKSYGYGLFSARYANIYCVRQLLQIAKEAFGEFTPADAVWERDGRFFDAMRPSVEPNGLASAEHVKRHRESHLRFVRQLFESADVLIFTFGLTEAWVHAASGTVYPTAPETIAGSFDPKRHEFKNFTFNEIIADFLEFRSLLQRHKPEIKFLLTVSPVPLTATATDEHVLQATTYSKSVLRAVAGELYMNYSDIDYFPSYEMVVSPFSRGFFFESNLRSVNAGGVAAVMRVFFAEHRPEARPARAARRASAQAVAGKDRNRNEEEAACEDELLEAFAK